MINYLHIADAERFYSKFGFQRISVPWAVPRSTMEITSPPDATLFPLSEEEGCLVASGEQSFLHMMLRDDLPRGKWMCITPCFRDNGRDELHQPYFLKLELFNTSDVSSDSLQETIYSCRRFFERYTAVDVVAVEPEYNIGIDVPDSTYDIVTAEHRIELGSYGIRHHPEAGPWIFATGVAEPRLSIAIEKETL